MVRGLVSSSVRNVEGTWGTEGDSQSADAGTEPFPFHLACFPLHGVLHIEFSVAPLFAPIIRSPLHHHREVLVGLETDLV